MTTADQFIKCCDCGEMFVFSVNEQKFFAAHQLHPPRRCKPCRAIRKQFREAYPYQEDSTKGTTE